LSVLLVFEHLPIFTLKKTAPEGPLVKESSVLNKGSVLYNHFESITVNLYFKSTMSKNTKIDKNLSLAKSLFLGTIVEENLFPFPKIDEEEAETLRIVLESVDKFMSGRDEEFREFDKVGAQPEEYINSLKELGLFGLIIGEEFGGIGFSNSAYARVIEQTSHHDASTSLTIGAHSSIGMKGLLLFGNPEQKKKYLPDLATGKTVAAFCLTEAGAGSDAASVSTNASKNEDGSWTLSGEKIWITNGAFADFFTVFAKTDSEKGKISAFIVERSFEGVSNGPKEDKMGIRASATTTITFDNVKVPAENLLGEEGKGFKIAMAILNNGRTGLGGGSVGAMKRMINEAILQASERKQFDTPIADFGLVQEKIAQMSINCYVTESIVAMVGHYIDSGSDDFSIEAAISKVFASEALWETANMGLQIAGGNGFMKEYPYEKVVRDSRINLIFEGTNEILRLYIALSGMKDAGNYLKDVQSSIGNIFSDPIKGFGMFKEYATRKFSHLTSLGAETIEFAPGPLRKSAEVYEDYTLELAKASEALLRKYKKGIIDEQFVLQRLADICIDITVGLAVLSRVSDKIKASKDVDSQTEIEILETFTHQAEKRIKANFEALDNNVDDKIAGLSKKLVSEGKYSWDTV